MMDAPWRTHSATSSAISSGVKGTCGLFSRPIYSLTRTSMMNFGLLMGMLPFASSESSLANGEQGVGIALGRIEDAAVFRDLDLEGVAIDGEVAGLLLLLIEPGRRP